MGTIKLKRTGVSAQREENVEAKSASVQQKVDNLSENYLDDAAVLQEYANYANAVSRHYKMNNGTAKSIISATPANYFDETEQKWKPIDNSLSEKTNTYEATCGKYKTEISKPEQAKSVKMTAGNLGIEWKYLGKQTPQTMAAPLSLEEPVTTTMSVEKSIEGNLKSKESKVLYKNADRDTDIEYILQNNNVKENIIIRENAEEYRYLFALNTQGLKLRISENNESLELYSESVNESGETVTNTEATIPAPFMYDANGESSDDVYFELAPETEGKYTFAVVASTEWINAERRAFPVTIDPRIVTHSGNFMSKQVQFRDIINSGSGSGSGSGVGASYTSWYNTNSEYIEVYRGTFQDARTILTVNKNKINFLDYPILTAKLLLTPYQILSSGGLYINGKYSYISSSLTFKTNITNDLKNAQGNFILTIEPNVRENVKALFYFSGVNGPSIEVEYSINGKIKTMKHQLTLAGGVLGEYNVNTGDLSIEFNDISSSDSLLGVGISHIYKNNGEDFHFGKNIRLNLNETLSKTGASALDADYVYTDAYGDKYGFKDTYYYINSSGDKTSVSKANVTAELDGTLSYTVEGKKYEVQKEQKTKTGLKAITKLEGFKNVELIEQRIDEQKQVEEQLINNQQILSEYVVCNIGSGALVKKAKDYLDDFDNFTNITTSQMILPLNDYIQYNSALLQIESSNTEGKNAGKYVSSSSYSNQKQYSDTEIESARFTMNSYSKYLADLRRLVRDLRADYATLTKKSEYGTNKDPSDTTTFVSSYQYDEYYKYLQENNIKEGLDTKICTFEGASTDITQLEESFITEIFEKLYGDIKIYFDKHHTHLIGGYCDLKEEIQALNNYVDDYFSDEAMGSYIKDVKKAQRDRQEAFEAPFSNRIAKLEENIKQFEQEINDFINTEYRKLYAEQIEYYKGSRDYHLHNAKKYYKEYVNLKYQAEMYKRQTPVNYLTDGKIYKGFNEAGNLVMIFDKYDNTLTIEYDEDAKIKRLYDGENKEIRFEYLPGGNLGAITDTRGRRTVYSYNPNGYLNKIECENGKSLIYQYNGNKLWRINSSDYTVSEFTYTGTTKVSITNLSSASSIVNGEINEITNESQWVQTDLVTLTHTDNLTTIESENEDKKYYIMDEDGYVYEYYEEENGKVVKAEKYDYVPYEKDNVQSAKRSSLYSKAYSSFTSADFTGGDTVNTVLDEFNNPVTKTTNAQALSDGTTQQTTVTYDYNDDHKCIKEEATVTIKEGTSVLKTYTQITTYNYNASGDVVRKESYVEGEEYTTGKTIEETVYDDKGNAIKSFTYNSLDSSSKFYTESDYAENGQVLADYDETGENKTEYEYISGTNVVRSEKYPNGSKFAYGHDVDDTVTSITQSTEEGEENPTHTRYTCGEVTELVSGNNKVNYEYDGKRRVTKVSLNDVEYLTSLNTDTNDGEKRVVKFAARGEDNKCDQYEVNKNKRGDIVSVGYAYEDKNATGEFAELYANEYDLKHRLVTVRQGDTVLESNEYDDYDRQTKHTFGVHVHETGYNGYGQTSKDTIKFGNDAEDKLEYVYAYDDEKASQPLAGITVGGFSENYEQDVLSRARKITQALGGKTYTKQYGYYKTGDHATSRVNTIYYGKEGITDGKVTYTYDCMGNIVSVNENGKQRYKYAYDKIGRLILEKDLYKGKEVCYTYDNNGNILTKSIDGEVTEYRYKEGTDRLVSFGTESIAYDNMGNPTTYKGMSCTWEKGRQLKSIEDASNRIEYEYDVKGIRTAKKIYTPKDATEPAQTTSYIYENGRLLRQIIESETIDFIYGAEGVMGFKAGTAKYLYRKNLLGDVTEIYNESGEIVGKYNYSAYGECETEVDTNGIATKNPIRYRGYYYDEGIGLYYLKSRYYDPEVGRFITIDDISYIDPETINGLNLYAYCGNNPVMNVDPNGTFFWFFFAAILIGAVIGGTLNGISAYNAGQRGWGLFGAIAGGAVMGGAMGGILALGGAVGVASAGLMSFGMTASTAFGVSLGIGAAAGMVSYSLENGLRTDREWSVGGMFKAGFAGALKGGATFWIGSLGGKTGAFDKLALKGMLGKELVKDSISYGIAKGLLSAALPSFLRNLFTWSSFYLGETLTKFLFISSVASGTRWLIDQIFGL